MPRPYNLKLETLNFEILKSETACVQHFAAR